MAKLEAQGGARLRIDEETGKPFWSLWGEGWKDGQDMEPGECVRLHPDTFPVGTAVVIHEPHPDSVASREFYAGFGLTSVGRLPDAPAGPVAEAPPLKWELVMIRLIRQLPRDNPQRKHAEQFLHIHGTGPLGALRFDIATTQEGNR